MAGVGLNDTTPAAPVGGNTGTTKGAQALIVFQQAAQLWSAQLSSSVEIRVDSRFQPLSCTVNQGTLGSAGPITVARDFVGAPRASTWYAIALANSRFGSDIDPANSDISMQFNGAMGTTGCLEGLSWYMGLDTAAPANSISLLSVALHEMGHGLGFLTFVNLASGAKLNGFDDSFMVFLERHSTALNYPAMTAAQRIAGSISNGDLHWTGASVLGATAR